ncbi:hypothetical protein GGTG_11174 [Gaeumannomyces tritici R3-111a-1]|uniref:UBC core domain-containing protein n=1 Tax=Gaeumannomyces tritici (strain R3-111a-1) TaxID=644352 RepID=J3PCF1_GAET3|nr:hypothetical protein GGTG_11174 [Gaeumannomyces tritici R3-111a-1]EJT71921.1 hypothetical protein GGTG_11174 [Gaeumannomyces tritici R3-111a-1]
MTARKFRADAALAAAEALAGRIDNVTSVEKGDDGEVVMTYVGDGLASPLQVRLLATNVDDYPGPCGFLLFTDCDDPPKQILQAMEEVQDHAASATSFTVLQAACLLARTLTRRLDESQMTDVDADLESLDGDDEDNGLSFESDDGDDAQDHEGEDLDHLNALMDGQPATDSHRVAILSEPDKAIYARIKRSLRKVRDAGGRVGIISGMMPNSTTNIVSISTRIRNLRLSEEALGAWGLSNSDYIVLLIQYQGGFPFLEHIMERPACMNEMKFRIAKCAKYKPTLSQAINAFDERNNWGPQSGDDEAQDAAPPLDRIFLSRSLDLYMSQYFISLLKIRGEAGGGMSWDDANSRLLDRIGSTEESGGPPPKRSRKSKGTSKDLNDHLADDDNEKSVLLISWQFAMLYLVDCTKYCLRCHRAIESGFGSLKPFVCSNSLCLFQYMQMGLGPSIEHEIMLQPTVVDLLVSFCYVSAQPVVRPASFDAQKFAIREFPVGLSLNVPDIFHAPWHQRAPDCIPVHVDVSSATATLYNRSDWPEDLRPGRWFVLLPSTYLKEGGALLTQEESKTFGPYTRPAPHTATLDPSYQHAVAQENHTGLTFGIIISTDPADGKLTFLVGGRTGQLKDPSQHQNTPLQNGGTHIALFNVDFDSLHDAGKARAIRFILNTLPPIPTIKHFLSKNTNSRVRGMPNVPPAAMTLLEWIVATNRSVILQIEDKDEAEPEAVVAPQPPQSHNQPPMAPVSGPNGGPPAAPLPPPAAAAVAIGQPKRPGGEKVPDMDNFLQFRFAQGSPDKEERFNKELERAVEDENLVYPTIFAWHGSSIVNWHSIIRTGLDYKDTANGRAYGHGVYFSQNFHTSIGYGLISASSNWSSSQLDITTAIALSELVNIPDRFQSRHPHLVVQNVDWQQCRYLFVSKIHPHSQFNNPGIANYPSAASHDPISRFVIQDPAMCVFGPGNQALKIPLAAIPSSRTIDQGQRQQAAPTVQARDESDEEDQADKAFLGDDDADDEDDIIVISSDDNDSSVQEISPPPPPRPANLTDFRAGALDLSSLPRLQPPQNAGSAGKHLSRQIMILRQIQQSTPPHDLGWFIDFDNMENMFQLVVELHSFDKNTPLGHDMDKHGVQSVVLELRFGESFPFSPPFVRVIRPRFLPFLNGGGGHVTAGGAMCMQLLTSDGWSAACSIESVLVQVRFAITSTEPPARLAKAYLYGTTDYGVHEAIEAYRRAAQSHGWRVPEDLNRTANPEGSFV